MPNIQSAKKRMRQNEVRRQRNKARRTRLRTAVRQLEEAIQSGDAETARELWSRTQSVIDRSARLGIIHPNKAARKKERLSRRLREL